ncbi:putative aldehyde dehydrogenase [Leptodontidium sp. 2 PMI_412]|nr:putative aldehyde dehydrogenase [Leptodontidium sp. 2 PMI_412]
MSQTISELVAELNASFLSGKTLEITWRKEQLKSLWKLIDENESKIHDTITGDIGKPAVQIQVLEILLVKNDIAFYLEKMDEWLAPESVEVPSPFENWAPTIYKRPKGTCLIISTWNYPITLTLLPLAAVIACGNTGIIKPSELAPQTASLLEDLLPKYLDPTCFKIVNGDKDVALELLQYPYGHLLFTGGAVIGKQVMQSAAKNLTPVTLELGGKNSVLVTEKADVELAAKRIAWGKFAIAGQTCFAPNQVIVHESVYEAFLEALKRVNKEFYGDTTEPHKVGKIVNKVHWKRIMTLLESSKGEIVFGGKGDAENRFIEPTVMKDVEADDSLLQTEIFGPILPVLKYSTDVEGKKSLRSLSTGALGFFVFSDDIEQAMDILTWTSAGTAAINDVMGQIAPTGLPFGGVGASGMGSYRGKSGIDTFSHRQSVVNVPTAQAFEDMSAWKYPGMESLETVKFLKDNMEAKI